MCSRRVIRMPRVIAMLAKLREGEGAEEEMSRSIGTGTSTRWLAPAVLAIALVGSQTAQANDPAGSPDIVAAPQVQIPGDSRNLVAVPRDPADPQAERALRGDHPSTQGPSTQGPSTQAVAKLERPSARVRRVRREEERAQPRLRQEAVAIPWHRYGGGGVGLILGIGF
jgi:hypothetical protein